jgi:hypothetical protein
MLRNCFVREEHEHLILGSGIPACWLRSSSPTQPILFGPAPTKFGTITVSLFRMATDSDVVRVEWQSHWHGNIKNHTNVPKIEIHLPGSNPVQSYGKPVATENSDTNKITGSAEITGAL